MYYASSLFKNYVDVIVTLIKCNVDINQRNKRGDTVLMKLCDFNKINYQERRDGDYNIFDILIQNGLNINA